MELFCLFCCRKILGAQKHCVRSVRLEEVLGLLGPGQAAWAHGPTGRKPRGHQHTAQGATPAGHGVGPAEPVCGNPAGGAGSAAREPWASESAQCHVEPSTPCPRSVTHFYPALPGAGRRGETCPPCVAGSTRLPFLGDSPQPPGSSPRPHRAAWGAAVAAAGGSAGAAERGPQHLWAPAQAQGRFSERISLPHGCG